MDASAPGSVSPEPRSRITGLSGAAAGAALIVVMLASGCAGGLENRRQAAYDSYWQCVSHAVQPYVLGSPLPARQAALRAQAACNPQYDAFRDAQVAVVQSKLDSDSALLADRLGANQALTWRERVTATLTNYVITARRKGAPAA